MRAMFKRHFIYVLSMMVSAIWAGGCATTGDIEAVRKELAELRQQVVEVGRDGAENRARLEEQKATLGLLEKKLKEQEDQAGVLDKRVEELVGKVNQVGGKVSELEASLTVAKAAPIAETALPGPPRPKALGSQELYEMALGHFRAGQHGQAVLEFEDYIQRFPGSALASNAQYWIAEAYYSQRDFRRALQEFQKVVDQYPEADKASDAILKKGLTYIQLRQKDKAVAEFKRLLKRYPKAPAVALARKKLKELER
ncbi:MAG: tol-pal system protein YbgF [candidate division NC10 bacterium]|nr:tol-pal system protein YbgF [candidate division NC10 bacterium]